MADSREMIQRKADHIDLAFAAQAGTGPADERFYYEPLLAGHPEEDTDLSTSFLNKRLKFPLWVSSMTGGTELARKINTNLARMCAEFGFGMGLGSCRVLLEQPELLPDFNVRGVIGPDLPLFANLGLAQVERMCEAGSEGDMQALVDMLQADGLIIHINPLQEWLQPGGDRFRVPPVETIAHCLKSVDFPVIVKEVGQGMGPESLRAIFSLPLAAVELAAHGGTNFAMLELLREQSSLRRDTYAAISRVGHSAEEMIGFLNEIHNEMGSRMQCRQVIISGGLSGFLDGFYLMKKVTLPSIYGHASGFLKHAQHSYEQLQAFARLQTDGLMIAQTYLRVR